MPGPYFEHAIQLAMRKTIGDRYDASLETMPNILDSFTRESRVGGFMALRSSDGMTTIDTALTQLKRQWQPHEALNSAMRLEAFIKACGEWLQSNGVPTGNKALRRPHIEAVCWKAAWNFRSACYANAAWDLKTMNNGSGSITSPLSEGLSHLPYGTPYPNKSYSPDLRAGIGVYRGDNRGPKNIWRANGFQCWAPPRQTKSNYQPFFAGNAGDGVISWTSDFGATLNFIGKAAELQGGAPPAAEDIPGWLIKLAGNVKKIKGFIYEMGEPRYPVYGLRRNDQTPGVESIFLGVPNAAIDRWYCKTTMKTDGPLGPFPFTEAAVTNDNWTVEVLPPSRPRRSGRPPLELPRPG